MGLKGAQTGVAGYHQAVHAGADPTSHLLFYILYFFLVRFHLQSYNGFVERPASL